MQFSDYSTEELVLCKTVCDCLADTYDRESVAGHVFCAAAELLRVAVRSRTIHDPMPGQTTLT